MKFVNFAVWAVIHSFLFSARFIPFGFTLWWMRGLARLVYPFMKRRRALMLYNLELALGDETTEEEREEIAWKSFENLFITFAEVIHMFQFKPVWRDRFTIEGGEQIDEYIAQGRGFMVFGGHFGGWLSFYPVVDRFPDLPGSNLIARPPRNPKMQEMIEYLAGKMGGKIISSRGTGAVIEERLNKGEMVGFFMDQESRRGQGVFTTFFGQQASTHVVPGYLAWKNDTPLVPYWLVRKKPGHFQIIFRETLTYPLTDDPDENNRAVAQAITSEVERTIRDHPEQWLWAHNRWRRRPDGSKVTTFEKKKKKGSRTKARESGAYLSSEDVLKKSEEE